MAASLAALATKAAAGGLLVGLLILGIRLKQ